MISVLPGRGLEGTRTRLGFHMPSLTITGAAPWVIFGGTATAAGVSSGNAEASSLAGFLVEASTFVEGGAGVLAVLELHTKAVNIWDRNPTLAGLYDRDIAVRHLLQRIALAALYDGQTDLANRLEGHAQ